MLHLTINGKTLLEEVASIRFGEKLKACDIKLMKEMIGHLRNMDPKPIARQTILNWFYKENVEIRREGAVAFIYDYVIRNVTEEILGDEDRRRAYDQVLMFTSRKAKTYYDNFKSSEIRSHYNIETQTDSHSNELASSILAVVSFNNMLNMNNEINDLFSAVGSSRGDEFDQSYFLIYRHSTVNSAILKSFLVIKKPLKNGRGLFTFSHFVWGGLEFQPNIFKESQGVMLKMDKGYYWVGYNYRVHADKRNEPSEYAFQRKEARKRALAIEVITAEYDEIQLSHGLFSGLTLTSAASNQPVVARLAMLHLGTRASLSQFVSDMMVLPSEISNDGLENDIIETVTRMREAGCLHFGAAIHGIVNKKPEVQKKIALELGRRIRKMILNLPDRSALHGDSYLIGDGAIETYSDHPNNRPRR
jgi:ribosomal protein L20